MKNLRETLVPFNRSMLFKTFFFLLVCTVLLVGFIFPSGTRGSFNQKWSLCQGCSGSGLRVFPRHRGSLLSGAGRGPRPPRLLPPGKSSVAVGVARRRDAEDLDAQVGGDLEAHARTVACQIQKREDLKKDGED